MAEAIELNLPLGEDGTESVEKIIKPLLNLNNDKQKPEDKINPYDIENYYPNDTLGSDVLKQKYLAPNEKHPHEMWKRQAKALASVEKNKEEWEEKFYAILENFKFVPGGRIMNGLTAFRRVIISLQ